MTEVPEKGRDTTREGRTSGLTGWNSVAGVSVSFLSASECLGFAPEANSQVYRVIGPLRVVFALCTQKYLCVSVGTCGYFHGHGRIRSSSSRSVSWSTSRSSSRSCRSGAAASQSRTPSTAPTALCGSGGERQSPPQYRAEAGACPRPDRQSRTRRAANESAVAPVASERLSTSSKAAVGGSYE